MKVMIVVCDPGRFCGLVMIDCYTVEIQVQSIAEAASFIEPLWCRQHLDPSLAGSMLFMLILDLHLQCWLLFPRPRNC